MMVAIVQTQYFLDSEYCCMFFGQEFQVSFDSQVSAVFFSLDFRFYFFAFLYQTFINAQFCMWNTGTNGLWSFKFLMKFFLACL